MESNRWKLNIKVVSGLVCIIFPIYFSLFFWTFFLMLFLQKFESKQSFNGHLMITNIFTVIFSFQNILSYIVSFETTSNPTHRSYFYFAVEETKIQRL